MKTNIQFKGLLLLALCAMLSSFSVMPGRHSFQVYLDGKLMADQYAGIGLTPELVINTTENHTSIMVKYNECGRTVSGRALILKDDKGNIVKEWKFEGETSGYKDSMSCSIKDLVALKQSTLKLYYSSTDFPAGQQVATIIFKNTKNT